MSKKRVIIVVDTGFDGCKMCINGYVLNIPFMVEDITTREVNIFSDKSSSNYIIARMDGKTYLVGERARQSLLELDHRTDAAQMDTFYTIGRFADTKYRVGLKTCLAYGLYMYANSTDEKLIEELNNGNVEIVIGVALPHQQDEELWTNHVKPILMKPIDVILEVGSRMPVHFDFNINETNMYHNSQAISAMFAVTLKEDGSTDMNEIDPKHRPLLVIDAGYMTVGIFKLSRDGRIDQAESNQQYAMHNINTAVAGEVKKYRPEIEGYNIEALALSGETVRYKESGSYRTIDIADLRKKQIIVTAENLMNYLVTKFNDLLDIKSAIVAGGTGKIYNEYLAPEFEKRGIRNILATPTIDGKEYEPVFAVAIGLYRSLLNLFNF